MAFAERFCITTTCSAMMSISHSLSSFRYQLCSYCTTSTLSCSVIVSSFRVFRHQVVLKIFKANNEISKKSRAYCETNFYQLVCVMNSQILLVFMNSVTSWEISSNLLSEVDNLYVPVPESLSPPSPLAFGLASSPVLSILWGSCLCLLSFFDQDFL